MHISQVDLNLFVVLETIYTAGGITRAAETLHLSQSAISHALSRLREIFKDPLFVRQGNIMVPTPFARTIIEPIRRGIAALETSLNGVSYFDPSTSKKSFKLGMSSSYETLVLPKVMEYIAMQAPQVDVTVCSWDRSKLETEFLSGNIDVALDICAPVGDGIRSKRFSSHEFVVLARANHPTLQPDVPICLETYLEHEHILVTSRKKELGLEDIALSQQNRARTIRLRCLSYFAGCEVVSRTNLLLTAPIEVALNFHKEFKNQISPFPFASAFDTYLYWHTNMENDPANAWLRQTLLSAGNSHHSRQHMA
jgi:DNA-binding transcriptional LysR family regulator